MASVLVSFTVTALFSVSLPRFHILSQVDAAAVTDEVSLIAVPAKIPKASPCMVSNPIAFPRTGKKIAASTLKKKMTAIDWATSLSSASITGAVAAMAEPPQMDDPTPTNIEVLADTLRAFCKIHAIRSDVVIVQMIMGRDCLPVSKITPRFIPNPSRTTAVCRMIFDVHLIPASAFPFFLQNIAMIIPAIIAITAPPTTGNVFPRSHAGIAIARQTRIPLPFFFMKFICSLPLFRIYTDKYLSICEEFI